jgi:hypothetical protein
VLHRLNLRGSERSHLRNVQLSVVVAMANKLARIAWAVLSSGEDYRPNSDMVTAS